MTSTIQASELNAALDQLDVARYSQALVDAERARIASRKRRDRRVVVAVIATILAGAGLGIGQVHHQENVARNVRVAEVSANTLADGAFIRASREDAGREHLAVTLAESAARRAAANEAINTAVAAAQERLVSSDGKVLDGAGRDALAAAITEATAIRDTVELSIWTVEAQPALIATAQAQVDADVAAWETEQARIAEEARIAAEREAARVAAEKAAIEAARRAAESAKPAPKAQAPAKQSTAPAPSTPNTGSASTAPAQASGEYRTSAANGYGATISYANCGLPNSTGKDFWVSGCYPGSGSTIYLSPSALSADSAAKRRIVDGVAQHEAAHFLITQKCGSSNPAIAGGRSEQVTDAYTALYVGGGTGGYGYAASDADAARSINAGVCS